MPAPSLSTPAARIEIRDLATNTYWTIYENERHEDACGTRADLLKNAVATAAEEIRSLGFLVTTDYTEGASSFATITVTACDGSSLTLDWEPMVDGFDYAESGDDACDLDEQQAQHEDEPNMDACDFCDGVFPEETVSVTGHPDGGIVYICDNCRAKDENAPRDCA